MNIKQLSLSIAVLFLTSQTGYTEEWTIDRTVNAALNVSSQIAVEKLGADEAVLVLSAAVGRFQKKLG